MPDRNDPNRGKARELLRDLRDAADERTEVTEIQRTRLAKVRMPESFLPALQTIHDRLVSRDQDNQPQLNTAVLLKVSKVLAEGDDGLAGEIFDQLRRPWEDYQRFINADKPMDDLPNGWIG
jgi:hypothetical protein